MSPPALLELQSISRRFGERAVLSDVNLRVFPGERLVLMGPSGCGKTTLLHVIALLDHPDQGRVLFRGEEMNTRTEKERSRIRAGEIGMIFQQFHLFPGWSLRDNLRFAQRYRDQPDQDEHCDRILEDLGLYAQRDQPARVLSGGEQQRLCIARALLGSPALLIADEPTGNLDERNTQRVREQFIRSAERNVPVLIATHDPEWCTFATRCLKLTEGRLEELSC